VEQCLSVNPGPLNTLLRPILPEPVLVGVIVGKRKEDKHRLLTHLVSCMPTQCYVSPDTYGNYPYTLHYEHCRATGVWGNYGVGVSADGQGG
jgi:hypothetical protein